MTTLEQLRRRAWLAVATVAFAFALPEPRETLADARLPYRDSTGPIPGVEAPDDVEPVTARDLAESNAKVALAYDVLAATWNDHFEAIGETFAVPRLLRYRGAVRTSCGVMPQDNAVYCPARNSIYFDEIFLAAMARRVGGQLGTDGDMAAVGVIAHEMGHAVAIQLGHASRFTYENEATADCLAGAFTRESQREGYLEKGDLEEAFLGMAMAGDPDPVASPARRPGDTARARRALTSHGTREQRMQNFGAGLDGGASACLPHFDVS